MSAAPRSPGCSAVQSEPGLEGARRVTEPALRDLDVGQGERAAEHVGEVARPPMRLRDRLGVAALRPCPRSPARPVREPQQRGGAAPAEVVGGLGELEHPAGVGDRAVDVAGEQRQARPGTPRAGRGGGRSSSSSKTIGRRRRAAPAVDSHDLEQRLDAGRRRRWPSGRRPSAMASTGRSGKTSSGSASSQRRSVASWRVRRIAGAASSMSCAARSKSLAGHGVGDRLGPVAVRLVPVARPAVELGDRVGLLVEQPGPEHVGEEVVVAVPGAAIVERDEEEVRPVELLEHRPARRAGR